MSARLPWRWAGLAGVTILSVLCILPVAVLLPAAASNPAIVASALSPRRLGLLATSVRLATLVFLADTAIAAAAVLWAHSARPRRAYALLAVALAAAFVPPVAHGAAWAGVSEMLRTLLGLAVAPLTDLPAAALAQGTAFLPFAIAISLAGVAAIDPALIDAARVLRGDDAGLRRVVLPLALPAILAGGGVAALLSLGDEAVPSAFGVSTAAMELFSAYAADGNAGATLALAWPLALAATATALTCASVLRRVSQRPGWGRRGWSAPPVFGVGTRLTLAAGAGLAVTVSSIIFMALFAGAWPPVAAARAVSSAVPDIATTAAVALTAGLVAGLLALFAGAPAGPSAPSSRWVWALALTAAIVPAPVMGAGLITLCNTNATAALYDSSLMLVLASLARFAPLAAVAVAVAATRLDARALEASIMSAPPWRAFRHVVAPQLARPAVAGGLLVAAFSAGELGATLMVLPPGTSTAVVRAFNLLHYGASLDVAALALILAVLGLATAAAAAITLQKAWPR
jgi:iron(III) transport system permease protein